MFRMSPIATVRKGAKNIIITSKQRTFFPYLDLNVITFVSFVSGNNLF